MIDADLDIQNVIEEGRVAHLAVASTRGPHVVPLLYAATSGGLWFLTAAATLTARSLDPRARAGVLVRAGERSVVLTGTLHRIDPLRAQEVLGALGHLGATTAALTRYALRNAPDLLAFGRDAVLGRAGRLPPTRRVLLRFDPEACVVTDGEVVSSVLLAGTPAPTTAGVPGPAPGPSSVAAVLGLCNRDGPVPLPARWDAAASRGWIPASLVHATGVDAGPGDLALDAYRAPGPAAKRGRLVRGSVEWIGSRTGQ